MQPAFGESSPWHLLLRQAAQASPLPPPSCEDLRAAIRHFPVAAGRGMDSLTFARLRELPDQGIRDLGEVSSIAEREQCWPTQVSLTRVALIPKSSPGWRPISLTSALYRVWSALRASAYKGWDRATSPDWDATSAGQSLEARRLQDELLNEVDSFLGKSIAQVLFDLTTFYDTVGWGPLVRAALRLGYPPLCLAMAINQAQAPRYLSLEGALAAPILPARSLLAGCAQSTFLSKVVLRPIVLQVLRTNSGVTCRAFVDDLRLRAARGTAAGVLASVVPAAVQLGHALQSAGLVVSSKSVAVTNPCALASRIARACQLEAVPMTAVRVAKDLGVDSAVARRRTQAAISKRRSSAGSRATRLRVLKRAGVKPKRFWVASAFAQARWSAAVYGTAPSRIDQLRSAAARAVSAAAQGRCRTTLLALDRPGSDPAVALPMQLVSAWLELLVEHPLGGVPLRRCGVPLAAGSRIPACAGTALVDRRRPAFPRCVMQAGSSYARVSGAPMTCRFSVFAAKLSGPSFTPSAPLCSGGFGPPPAKATRARAWAPARN